MSRVKARERAVPDDRSSKLETDIRTKILAQLNRILSSPHFASTAQRKALLTYLVTETIEGRGDRLKGFTVAVAVFRRDETFDSQNDPIVRLEVRMLRSDLDSYYVSAGRSDPIRLSIPKGHYSVHFDTQGDADVPDAVAVPEQTGRLISAAKFSRPWTWRSALALSGVAVIFLALAGLVANQSRGYLEVSRAVASEPIRGPVLVVLAFDVSSDSEDDRLLAVAMAQEITFNLMRFSEFRLHMYATGNADDPTEVKTLWRDLAATYVVRGSLQTFDDTLRVIAQLVDAKSGEVIWSNVYDRPVSTQSIQSVQVDLSESIAVALGEPNGEVLATLSSRLAAYPTMESYRCILLASEYRRVYTRSLRQPVLECLNAALKRDSGYADAWAYYGLLNLDGVRLGDIGPDQSDAAMKVALQATTHALELSPNDTFALQSLAAVRFALAQFDEAELLARRAIALNPNDPQLLAMLGWRLCARERWEEGLPMLNEAIARSVRAPGWYYNMLAIHAYLEGDLEAALVAAEKTTSGNYGIGWSLVAIVQGALGNVEEAQMALREMEEAQPYLAKDPAAVYRSFQGTDRMVTSLVAGLEQAGLEAAEKKGP